MSLESDIRNDPKVIQAASQTEEQIGIGCIACLDLLSGRKNDVVRHYGIDGQPKLIRLPGITSTQTQTRNAC